MSGNPTGPREPYDDSLASDWHALLNGGAPASPAAPARPAAPSGPPAGQPAPPAGRAASGEPSPAPAPAPVAVETGPVPVDVDGRPLTRREIRELERRRQAAEGTPDAEPEAPGRPDQHDRLQGGADAATAWPAEPADPFPAPVSAAAAAEVGAADAPAFDEIAFDDVLADGGRNDRFAASDAGSFDAGDRQAVPGISELLGVTEPTPEPGRPSRAERRLAASTIQEHHDPEARPKRRGGWGCLVGLVVLVALVAGAWFFLQAPVAALLARFEPAADYTGSGSGEVTFMIHEGDTGSDIATNLVDDGVTASYDAFYDLLLEQNPEPEFHPGAYQLAEKMSAAAALGALQDPATKLENTFVIPEGTALPDVLQLASEGGGIPLDQLQAAAAEPPASYGLPAEATSLEGFLAPRTYTLDPNQDAHAVLQALVDRQFQALDEAGVPADQRWRTIVLASIVQREAGTNLDDFPKIARVFQNRLDQGINLESDATVAYGTGNTDTVWTTDEERADASNPYNTYANPGLPVGPIGNPGDVAIDAAVHPADGTWLFFVPVNLETGETVFSTTVEEHDAAVAQLQEWCEANADSGYCD